MSHKKIKKLNSAGPDTLQMDSEEYIKHLKDLGDHVEEICTVNINTIRHLNAMCTVNENIFNHLKDMTEELVKLRTQLTLITNCYLAHNNIYHHKVDGIKPLEKQNE